jgi:hypothetical protein
MTVKPVPLFLLLSGLIFARAEKFNCVGEYLRPGETLYPNDYIGPNWACPNGGYRFGLDKDGFLGAWEYSNTVMWHSGVQGDYLRMQLDGNLVLNKADGTPVWANNCPGEGVYLRKFHNMPLVKAMDKDGTLVWSIYNYGEESACYPKGNVDGFPEVRCRGNILSSATRLYPNEYICDPVGQHIRFGLNDRGRMALWIGKRVLWSPPLGQEKGDFLAMQGDGNLVLYKDNDTGGPSERVWSSDCFADNAILKLESGGIKVEKRNGVTLWMINSLGEESECNPSDEITSKEDCSSVSPFGDECVVQMIDFLNMNIVNLQVKDLGKGRFTVTDNYDGESCHGGDGGEPWEVSVEVQGNGNVDIDAGVPDVNCQEMLTTPWYQMEDDVQLTFRPNENHMCNLFGRNLIYFMVMQWFYFG